MIQKGNKIFGLRLKELREKKGYTQEQLSELIDIDARSLSRIETGASFTTFDKLNKLAHALNVKVEDLFKDSHIEKKEELIKNINTIIEDASYAEIKTIFRLIMSVMR